jgi:hypothetical protein
VISLSNYFSELRDVKLLDLFYFFRHLLMSETGWKIDSIGGKARRGEGIRLTALSVRCSTLHYHCIEVRASCLSDISSSGSTPAAVISCRAVVTQPEGGGVRRRKGKGSEGATAAAGATIVIDQTTSAASTNPSLLFTTFCCFSLAPADVRSLCVWFPSQRPFLSLSLSLSLSISALQWLRLSFNFQYCAKNYLWVIFQLIFDLCHLPATLPIPLVSPCHDSVTLPFRWRWLLTRWPRCLLRILLLQWISLVAACCNYETQLPTHFGWCAYYS